jgi:23S rRNA-/tRNA-specific pseudouridylate synthase
MARPSGPIELPTGEEIPVLYEDRSVLAIDKPRGWMLAPASWQKTGRNLQAALESSIRAGDFWARSRGLKFLRFVHRLDAGTSGVLLANSSAPRRGRAPDSGR